MVTSGMPRVGVLALQGDVREHVRSLEALGAEAVAVRRPAELATVSGLVIPGGESSVIDKLARTFGLQQPIRAAIADGMPVYGTCAGLILLADRIADGIRGQESVGGLDITVQRNAFGSQIDSFETQLEVAGFDTPVSATFIRAPRVVQTGPEVDVLASLPDGAIVAVRQGALLGTAFHPEMAGETRFHQLLLDLIAARAS
ncbi:pyridoxal 5'-phosphate synthase glutaminase subunit PdxT [Microbacterium laevaniformans]|uniref:Pyridoxal 5'-phosphate synthase subunit PdxT n=1 Tax=Microbacterium laevaniformans TaxID=36807 RepID=A0A4S2DA07_9MICO|nr:MULTISPECIES: pyridoxal 5'-phosphate synthase glutaminase subunit PdxT [Microbacterium]AXA95896.1 pyridoxal 5'-phosphate synthase glutaminase subunit PdxT [Microbacterium sp. PM5]TGY37503.1 pyridoxal 5'-phosphate synthase glutaminase subunit PdxT [Microbacterium laevaniformans]